MATVSDDLIRLYTSSDAVALGEHVRRKDISAAEAVEAAIVVIERLNPQLNAVIHRLYDMARAQVPNVPPQAPFAGVPFLLKELASMWQGAPLTNSCAWLKDARAPEDFGSDPPHQGGRLRARRQIERAGERLGHYLRA